MVEVTDGKDTIVFVLFDHDINLLINMTCEELLTQSLQDVSGNSYPSLLDSLIGQKILFKVETKVEHQMQFEGSYVVRRVCVDEDIIAMFELSGVDFTPTKTIFAPLFPKVSNDDIEEPFHDIVSELIAIPINLGDDDFRSKVKCTPAKRKLDAEFASCQVGCSSSRQKLGAIVEIEDDVDPVCALVPVKIEKE